MMCTTCGCGIGSTLIGGRAFQRQHKPDGPMRFRSHDTTHVEEAAPSRIIKLEHDLLAKNNSYAEANRRYLSAHGIFALNLVSSPGSGKTTLLVKTIGALNPNNPLNIEMSQNQGVVGRVSTRHVGLKSDLRSNELSGLNRTLPLAVIEGDQQTENDAERIRAAGAPAIQINTGKGCHLDAQMVGQAMQRLGLQDDSLLLIENVGNLVCPASFDLGEAHKVVILSVTEGEDKPLKYPDMFRAADLMLLNKCDLLPHLDFNADLAIEYARRINPKLQVIRISASSGEGMSQWLAWIKGCCRNAVAAKSDNTNKSPLPQAGEG